MNTRIVVAFAILAAGTPAVPLRAQTVPAIVHVRDFAFTPSILTVDAGTTVSVVNDDEEPHTMTALDKSFDSQGLDLHQTWKHVFSKAGTYAYYCQLHPSMKGRIVVRASAEQKL